MEMEAACKKLNALEKKEKSGKVVEQPSFEALGNIPQDRK